MKSDLRKTEGITEEQQEAFCGVLMCHFPDEMAEVTGGDLDSLLSARFFIDAASEGRIDEEFARSFRHWFRFQFRSRGEARRRRVSLSPQSVHNQSAVGELIGRAILELHDHFREERSWLGLPESGADSPESALRAILAQNNLERQNLSDEDEPASSVPESTLIGRHSRSGTIYLNQAARVPCRELQLGALYSDLRDVRIYVLLNGPLDQLRARAVSVAKRFRLAELVNGRAESDASDHALKLMLTGVAPEYCPVRIEVHEGPHTRLRVHGQVPPGFDLPQDRDLPDWMPDQLGRLDRITLSVDPSMNGDAVAKLYEEQRRLLRPAPNEPSRSRQDNKIADWKLDLARLYMSERSLPDPELLAKWNALGYERKFKYASDIRRIARETIRELLDPGRPKSQ